MTPEHHPDDSVLFQYTAGGLGAPWDLALSAHLTFCPRCRTAVSAYEESAALALEDAAPIALSAADPGALIARAGGPETAAPRREPAAPVAEAVFPRAVRDLAGGDLDAIRWSPVGGGVKQKILMWRGPVSARLLHIAPGVAVAEHGHRGLEFTAVLSGGYFDGGAAYRRGDIQIVAHEDPHRPTAMPDRPCVCLAVTDAPLRFRQILPRLVQRFMKI